jgi:hypothetical protein
VDVHLSSGDPMSDLVVLGALVVLAAVLLLITHGLEKL